VYFPADDGYVFCDDGVWEYALNLPQTNASVVYSVDSSILEEELGSSSGNDTSSDSTSSRAESAD
jgi:hypothetical protein